MRVRGSGGAFRVGKRLVVFRRDRDQHDELLPAENFEHLPGPRQDEALLPSPPYRDARDLSHLRKSVKAGLLEPSKLTRLVRLGS